nr:MAG TPA: hypothetical protein [Caudoviricetes sp.]
MNSYSSFHHSIHLIQITAWHSQIDSCISKTR